MPETGPSGLEGGGSQKPHPYPYPRKPDVCAAAVLFDALAGVRPQPPNGVFVATR